MLIWWNHILLGIGVQDNCFPDQIYGVSREKGPEVNRLVRSSCRAAARI